MTRITLDTEAVVFIGEAIRDQAISIAARDCGCTLTHEEALLVSGYLTDIANRIGGHLGSNKETIAMLRKIARVLRNEPEPE